MYSIKKLFDRLRKISNRKLTFSDEQHKYVECPLNLRALPSEQIIDIWPI